MFGGVGFIVLQPGGGEKGWWQQQWPCWKHWPTSDSNQLVSAHHLLTVANCCSRMLFQICIFKKCVRQEIMIKHCTASLDCGRYKAPIAQREVFLSYVYTTLLQLKGDILATMLSRPSLCTVATLELSPGLLHSC